jgi:hypothetical protein
MNEGFEQFLATIIAQCLDEHDMQPPLVVRTVGDNGSVLVAGFKEGAELVVLTKHCENDTFTLPLKVTIVSQNNRTARLVIERDGNSLADEMQKRAASERLTNKRCIRSTSRIATTP